jgi:ATP-binding cassette subfamily F protein uup
MLQTPVRPASVKAPEHSPVALPAKKKLTYKDARELEALPALIERLESEVAAHTERMQQPDFYQQTADRINAHTKLLADVQSELDHAYGRWAELDG